MFLLLGTSLLTSGAAGRGLGPLPGERRTVARLRSGDLAGLVFAKPGGAGRAIDALAGQALVDVRPGQPSVDVVYVNWHTIQVFKGHGQQPAQ